MGCVMCVQQTDRGEYTRNPSRTFCQIWSNSSMPSCTFFRHLCSLIRRGGLRARERGACGSLLRRTAALIEAAAFSRVVGEGVEGGLRAVCWCWCCPPPAGPCMRVEAQTHAVCTTTALAASRPRRMKQRQPPLPVCNVLFAPTGGRGGGCVGCEQRDHSPPLPPGSHTDAHLSISLCSFLAAPMVTPAPAAAAPAAAPAAADPAKVRCHSAGWPSASLPACLPAARVASKATARSGEQRDGGKRQQAGGRVKCSAAGCAGRGGQELCRVFVVNHARCGQGPPPPSSSVHGASLRERTETAAAAAEPSTSFACCPSHRARQSPQHQQLLHVRM